MMKEIKGFTGEYKFLSNFYPCTINYGGLDFKSSESLYMSQKSGDFSDLERFSPLDASKAKELGKNIVAGAVEGKINLSTYGIGGTLLRKTYGGWKAGKEAQKLAAEKTAEAAKKVELGAGIRKNSLEDIKKGKQ